MTDIQTVNGAPITDAATLAAAELIKQEADKVEIKEPTDGEEITAFQTAEIVH